MSARLPRGLLLLSLLCHILALAGLQYWGMESRVPDMPEMNLRMVQLVGGGNNRPGWVRPPDAAPAPPSSPIQEPVAEPLTTPARPTPRDVAVAPAVEPSPAVIQEPASVATETPRDETPVSETAVSGQGTDTQATTQTPSRTVDRPGPKGPGVDMTSDNTGNPGISNWLRRNQAVIYRNFRYPARNSGRAVVYHFIVQANGTISEPELRRESGDPVLDHAGLVAVRSSQLSPLPPDSRLKALGVTITFRD